VIVVKLEMWPGGKAERAVEFGRMLIMNQMTTTQETRGELGDYLAEARGGVYGRPDLMNRVWKSGQVRRFNRKTRGAWDLLYLALRGLVGDRNR